MDILDQEAHENEKLLSRQPNLSQSRPPSHVANNHLITAATQYDATIKQAASSDMTVKSKWNQWAHLIGILADGKVKYFEIEPWYKQHTDIARMPSRSMSPLLLLLPVAPCPSLSDLSERHWRIWTIEYLIAHD